MEERLEGNRAKLLAIVHCDWALHYNIPYNFCFFPLNFVRQTFIISVIWKNPFGSKTNIHINWRKVSLFSAAQRKMGNPSSRYAPLPPIEVGIEKGRYLIFCSQSFICWFNLSGLWCQPLWTISWSPSHVLPGEALHQQIREATMWVHVPSIQIPSIKMFLDFRSHAGVWEGWVSPHALFPALPKEVGCWLALVSALVQSFGFSPGGGSSWSREGSWGDVALGT